MSRYEHGGDIFGTARRMGIDSETLLDFSASINPLGMPEGVKKAILGAVDRLAHYPDPYSEPLREAIAAYHGVSSGEILPVNGSTELIFMLPRLIAGNRALIIAPAFSEYANALAAAGWEIQHHILSADEGFTLNLDSLKTRMAAGYDMLFLCNPGNPSGCLYSRDEITQVMALCRDRGVFLVLDEAFIDFCGEEASMLRELVAAGKGVVLRSLTKFYAIPGLRLGYAAASADICGQLADIRGPWSVNTLAQSAGLAALSDSVFREAAREFVVCEREHLSRLLADIPGVTPCVGAANYLLVRLDDRVPVSGLCRSLLVRHGILVRDCSSFAGVEHGFFRVAVRLQEHNMFLAESIKEVLLEYES